VWTPRRILLLLAALGGFSAVYLGYAVVLGGIDGLPDLPRAFLDHLDIGEEPLPPVPPVPPTMQRLMEAFGPGSQEVVNDNAYKTRLEYREKGMTFACGQLTFKPTEPSPFVPVAPFSVAVFGKPKPPAERAPGEVVEISTIHSDEAILQYDRPVSGIQDIMNGKAKLVGIELRSTPDVPSPDVRRGHVWLTNNQRSADPNQFLVFKTPGPLFYRTADAAPAPDAPQIWTAAAVQVTDRKNLPRPLRAHAPVAVPARPDDLRGRNAVANILLGLTSPPPTMTAEGMKVYLQPDDKTKGGAGYSGVKTIELAENVQVSLWSSGGGGGFPGSGGSDAPAKPAAADPPAAAGAALGGFADGAAVARRLADQSLLVIRTLGKFRYDYPTSTATFEAAAAANPALPNHVTAFRQSAGGGTDDLICKALEIRFGDGKSAKGEPGMKIKALTATGDHVFVSVEAEQLSAQGTRLQYETSPTGSTTVLRGSPVNALRERNQIMGGEEGKPPVDIRIVATEPPAGSKEKRQSTVAVVGPGRLELLDASANANTVQATWGTSLTQKKVVIGGKEQDLLVFDGGGTFADVKGGMSLAADRLMLWLGADADAPAKAGGQPAVKPQQLVATGRVRSESEELRIRDTDQLTVYFRDVAPRLPAGDPTKLASGVVPASHTVLASPEGQPADGEKKPADKPKVPMYLSARDVKSWVVRYPLPDLAAKPPAGKPAAPAGGGLKYELERAYCEDRVKVHQPPADPAKAARGVDIFGSKLNLDQSPAGGVLTVTGTADENAKVYFEDMMLVGPVVKIDQVQNTVAVDGKGELKMPGGTDPNAADRADGKTSELKVQWLTEMRFNGAMATANFLGQVYAVQQPPAADSPRRPAAVLAAKSGATPDEAKDETITQSVLVCHRLDVTFDRPVYFNQFRGTNPAPAAPGQPAPAGTAAKIRQAVCNPVADDEADRVRAEGRLDPRQVAFYEHVYGPGAKLVRAHRITARELVVEVDGREQQMKAAGPGEVRILQLGAKDQAAGPGMQQPPPGGKPAEEEMKLTVVNYPARMEAKDTRFGAGFFQEATFFNGARVVQVPSPSEEPYQSLNWNVGQYANDPPTRGVSLSCGDVLKVSSKRTRRDAPADQEMSAEGNAKFITDEYQGLAARITHDANAATLYGDKNKPAKLQQRPRVGALAGDTTIAETITYGKNGEINTNKGIGGAFAPGR
jgi:hypothetical protein